MENESYTLTVGREHFKYRTAKIGSISDFQNDRKKSQVISGNSDKSNHKIVFLFPGGGAQYLNMGCDLYELMPVFKKYVDECVELLRKNHGVEIESFILDKKSDAKSALKLEKPSNALPALFTIEYALAKMWMDLGIVPNEMMGHSMGEYTAACLADVMSLKDALALVTVRGKLFEKLPSEGGMLNVPISENEVGKFMNEELNVAVVNKPNNCVVSGTLASIDRLHKKLESNGVDAKRIHISVAAHSQQVDPILGTFRDFLENIELNKPQIPYISNVTGDWVSDEEATSPDFWVKHLRQAVRFSDGLERIFENPDKILIEVGPGRTLSTYAKTHPSKNAKQLILASMRHPKEAIHDLTFLQKSIAKLWVAGKDLNWEKYFEGRKLGRIPLPTYPFERKRYWIEPSCELQVTGYKSAEEITQNLEINANEPVFEKQYFEASATPSTVNHQPSTVFTMSNTTTQSRRELLTIEIKTILYELSGIEPEEMEVDASYLELGFDSLFLSQAVIQFNKQLKLDLSFRQMFEETPTIQALAEYADEILPKEMFQPEREMVQMPISSNGNGHSNENGHVDNGFNINGLSSNGNGNGQVGNSPIEQLIHRQLEVMEQQLAAMRVMTGGNGTVQNFNTNGNGISKKIPVPSSNGNGHSNGISNGKAKSNGQSEQKIIKRKVKGVTAKLNNYKNIQTTDDLTPKQREGLQKFIQKYLAMTPKSKVQTTKHREFYADPRAVTGFSKLWKEIVYQISADRSKGSKIWDVDGNEYVDFVMSYGVALFGHAPDFVQKAIIEQVEKGNSLDVLPPKSTEIARMICEMSGMERVTLANTGTEAVLGSVRAARTYTGREKIAVFDTDYHGLIGQFMLRGVHLKDRTNVLPAAAGIPSFVVKNTLVLDYDDPEVLAKLEAEIKNLAAVVIEPIQAQNPHWQHHDLMKKIREITAKNDVPLIFDEIINGFRLAQKGAQAWYGIEADIVAYGKSISGGLPMSAVAGKAKYMSAFDGGMWHYGDDSAPEGTMTYFASTFIKNKMSVASGHAAVLELYNRGENLQIELNAKAAKFANQICEIFLRTKAPLLIQCTSSFFMIKPADSNPLTRLFTYFLRFHGINMRERPCFISTAHTDLDLEKALKGIENAIKDMFEADLMQPYEGEDLNLIILPPKHLRKGEFWENQVTELPLTEGQKEVFVSAQFGDEANAAYNIGTEISIEGEVTKNQIENALRKLVDRHEALRIHFSKDGQKQFVKASLNFEIPFENLSQLSDSEKEEYLENLHSVFANTPFDLVNGPLFRTMVVQVSSGDFPSSVRTRQNSSDDGKSSDENGSRFSSSEPSLSERTRRFSDAESLSETQLGKKFLVLLTVHHSIADGWSLGILTRDLGQFLKQELGQKINLENARQFGDYVKSQIAFRRSSEFEKINNYWKNKFSDDITPLDFPTDFPRPMHQTYSADCQRIKFSLGEYKNIQKVAAKSGSTFYFFLFGAFQTYISRLAQQEDITMGIVAASQNLAGNSQLVGHAANLLPIRMNVPQKSSFKDHLKTVRSGLLDAFDHQNFTFGEVVRQIKINRDASRNPLVSVVFNMDSPLNNLDYGSLKATTRPIEKQFETFDLFINVKPLDDSLFFEWFYNTDLFKKQTILNRLEEFKTYLNGILENPEKEISELPIIPDSLLGGDFKAPPNFDFVDSKNFILGNEKSGGVLKSPPDRGALVLSKLFENQVLKTPNSTAIIFENQTFTYRQINERANQIAHKLIEKGVKPNTFVGMFLERTPDLIPSILGILKTGAGYLPLDTLNPIERLKVIVEDVDADFILTHSNLKNQLPEGNHEFIFTNEIQSRGEWYLNQNPNIDISENSNAYIIYTSGSTGKPKGVTITHSQISKHVLSMKDYLKFDESQTIFTVISSSFDPSVQDFFMPLFSGAKIILGDQNTAKDGWLLRKKLNESDATMMVATPPTWRMLLMSGWKGKSDLTIISTGEALSKKLAGELMNCGKELWNFYGPTETVIYATAKKVVESDLQEGGLSHWVSIGAALPETSIYILDKNGQPLPAGTPGEIFIGGFRVAKGYFNRPEKTAEVFLNNPFKSGETFYKTGDLGIMQSNGDILYINRMDNQVKLRGHRIELGEIEAKIREFNGVNEAVVLLREDEPGDKKLVGYIKKENDNKLIINNLKKYLSDCLPAYMIPSQFVELDEFPLTSAGKINRRQLPKPTENSTQISIEKQVEARTETEKSLSKIWLELLKIPKVGIYDNFYDLGGHSLMAVGMMAKIEDEFGVRLPLVTLIDNATIEHIAKKIDERLGKPVAQTFLSEPNSEAGDADKNVCATVTTKTIPLTEGQKEVWVSHNLHDEAAKSFNLGSEIRLKGEVDVNKLKLAIYDLTARHEALRTSIESDGKTQKVHSRIGFEIPFLDWSNLGEEEQSLKLEALKKREIERVFDLEKAPLATFHILKLKEGDFVLLISMHHILLDGWSLGVLTNDLGQLYQKRLGNNSINLPQPSQLSDFVEHKENWTQSADYQEAERFWLNQFSKGIPVLEFPTDKPIGKTKSFAADQASIYFSDDFIGKLKASAKANNMTFYTFMFAAFQAFTAKLAQQEDFVLGVSVSGKSIVQFNDLVAHRTNLLPLKINVNLAESFKNHLKVANRNLLTAFDYQDYTLGTLVKKLKVSRDTSRHPLVNVVFNMETMSRSYDFGDLEVETEFIPGNFKTLDLIVHMKPNKLGYEFKWIFKNEIFEKEEVERRLAEFETFLIGILENPELPIREISVLPEAEKAQILEFGKSKTPLNFDLKCMHEIFENQVLKTPHKTALVYENQILTYNELNKKANRLARYLMDNELKMNDFVGLCLEPSLEVIISIYAILKAGGTYVPLDPLNPNDRLKTIWEDANCSIMITQSNIADKTKEFRGNRVILDEENNAISKQNPDNLNLEISPLLNAYVIYTSGSTGKPKGVGIQHKSVVNTLFGIDTHLKIEQTDSFYSVSSMAFDMSIPDYFLALWKGATLILANSATKKDGFLLKEELEKYKPTVMQATPTTWKILSLSGWEGDENIQIIAGGEGFSRELAEDLLTKSRRVFNGYGPTEATIYSTYKEVNWGNISTVSQQGFIPIGTPNPNVECMILDAQNQLVPIGVAGELYIGGPGVARGYLGREELTNKVFVNGKKLNEYAGLDTWYKTGDLVRWLPNGDIDFLGRIDNQVKIRGFRIELGEIEESLIDCEGVEQAVVSVFKDKTGREILTAYVKMNPVSKMDEKALKSNLRKRLPGYMVPAVYVEIDEFPQTNSLKIDRKALPKPDLDSMTSERAFELPKNAIEEQLVSIWTEILGLSKVSTNEDFFELGGHSLVAVGLMARIHKEFGKKLPLTSLFQNSTIQKLAELIEGKSGTQNPKWSSLVPIKPQGKKAPIYLVHGGGLHVLFYQTLTKFLDKEQPVYALQAKGLDGKDEPLESIEEMAAHYIKEILEQNPNGPYNLAGYSLGGLIAYEMTRQLKAMGKEVKVLAMLDAVARHETDNDSKFKKNLRKAKFNLELMMKDPAKTAKYKAEVLKMQLLHQKGKVDMPHGETHLDPSENAGHLAGKRVYEKSMEAFRKYVLKPLEVRIDLFKAKDQMFYLSDPEFYGWNKFAQNGVAVHEIEGNHMTLFEEKSGRMMAEVLQGCLDG